MSYPYLTDWLNHLLGTHWELPIAMFGTFVALAFLAASVVAKHEIIRLGKAARLPQFSPSSKGSIPTHQLVSGMAFVGALFGIIGARLFHILENTDEFFADPLAMLLSRQGLSVYGGLIFGVIAGAVYLKKRHIPIIPMLDALAPSFILGYAIGRLGCQVSGDGDWGITANMAFKPNWLPDWFWAQTYQGNIAGVTIPSPGVYPTPLYETLTALSIFLFLWLIRKGQYSSGFIFSCYLLLAGFGRLLIEKIRINSEYHFAGMSITQAELISTIFIVIGLIGILKTIQAKSVSKVAFSFAVLSLLTACSGL